MSDKGKRVVVGDSALQKSFTPKVPEQTALGVKSTEIDGPTFKGSHQPQAAPIETKNVAPPSKDD